MDSAISASKAMTTFHPPIVSINQSKELYQEAFLFLLGTDEKHSYLQIFEV